MKKPISPRVRSFRHKMFYFGCIIVLMIPMFVLSQPATIGVHGESGSKGGLLEQERQKLEISELNLGEVNMTGEAIRLGTFGLDGVATLILWQKADEYKKKKDWTNLSATLKQLILLVPYFETVWRFQGWNLAYNVSSECDNYKDRYDWVIEGIRYLENGTRYNQKSIRLTNDVAWTTAHKISKSDEKVQFRQLFRQDDDFNKDRPLEQRDSWLVAREWYAKSIDMVDNQGVDLETISPTLFYSYPGNAQAYYSEGLQTDGEFGYKALRAWETFSREWKEFGTRQLSTTDGELLRLDEQEHLEALAEQYRQEMEALRPGLYDSMVAEKRAQLTPEELAVVDKPMEELTADEHEVATLAREKINVSNEAWALAMPSDLRVQARDLAKLRDEAQGMARMTNRYRMIVNYNFWKIRGLLECTDEIMEARKLVYEGDKAYAGGDIVVAKNNYDRAISLWAMMIAKPEYNNIIHEDMLGMDLREIVDRYEIILNQRNETLPEDFVLKDVIRENRPTDEAILRDMRKGPGEM